MTKKLLKKRSKRMSCRLKYKIEKKVREHKRKVKKEARKKKGQNKQKPKDPGIPNSLPFKDQILEEIEERKKRAEALKLQRKEEMKKMSLSSLKADAEKRTEKFLKKTEAASESTGQENRLGAEHSTKAYYKEFHKVVEAADVILEVLDARDPIGTRCKEVEQAIINAGSQKNLILLLNKVDLIPRENMLLWIKYLRNEFPTIAFKASTQVQKSNISRRNIAVMHSSESLIQSSLCVGAHTLMKLLGNYCRNKEIKMTIKVGVVGYPNVGKSSVINSLKRAKACVVGATPGVTKNVQEVVLDKHIKLLDSPGIVLSKESSSYMALHNALKIENLPDPIQPAQAIFTRVNKEQLMLHYRLPEFKTCNDFLSLLAKRIGKLKKGGVPDIEKAAKKVLQDWNTGRIKFYCVPPTIKQHISAEIVSELSKPFDIDSIAVEEEKDMDCLPFVLPSEAVIVENSGQTETENEQEEPMSEDEKVPEINTAAVIELDAEEEEDDDDKEQESTRQKKLLGNMQLNKARKVAFKKAKKKQKRSTKLAEVLSAQLDAAL